MRCPSAGGAADGREDGYYRRRRRTGEPCGGVVFTVWAEFASRLLICCYIEYHNIITGRGSKTSLRKRAARRTNGQRAVAATDYYSPTAGRHWNFSQLRINSTSTGTTRPPASKRITCHAVDEERTTRKLLAQGSSKCNTSSSCRQNHE